MRCQIVDADKVSDQDGYCGKVPHCKLRFFRNVLFFMLYPNPRDSIATATNCAFFTVLTMIGIVGLSEL